MSGPQIGDLKVWYTHQIPGKAYEQPVPDIATGFVILQAIYKVALFGFDNRWWPDYANAGGIVRYEDVGDGEIGATGHARTGASRRHHWPRPAPSETSTRSWTGGDDNR